MAKLKVVNNVENRATLAQDIVDSWDMNDLMQCALHIIEENLGNCDAVEFDNEWHKFHGEDT
jgi:hypothetical protein